MSTSIHSIHSENRTPDPVTNAREVRFAGFATGSFVFVLALVLAATLAQPSSADSTSELYYSYTCDCSGIEYPLSWEKCYCCQPEQPCPIFDDGVVVGYGPDFQTGDNGTEPYSGVLAPGQKLQLTIQCTAGGKVTGVKLHKDKIKCKTSQKTKGTKIYDCHNKSDKSHHSWELEGYQCPQKDN